jgi:signal transduction histidine kinase
VVTVRDNGIGMDAEQVAALFTMFSRFHPREEHPGAGLGLATCRRVVERHGGAIWADSLPGRGTMISFTLPAGDE